MDNPETQATLSTRHRGKTNKMKKMSSIDPPPPPPTKYNTEGLLG
jgi:hypothetical protein